MTREDYIEQNLVAVVPDTDECVIREHTVTIDTGGFKRTLTCTGSHIEELVRGFCYTEGESGNGQPAGAPDVESDGLPAGVTADITTQISPIDWTPEQIHRLARLFLDYEGIHTYTSGTHLAILARGDDVLCIMEDISRHCAIDKVIGYALLRDIDLSECMIYSSGRVQYDTIRKLVHAGVPMLVSKSVPTYEAIELAKMHGITLIGRAWPDGYTVFT
ncbi:MAG: formate dehydrogenase accessory sulfurtransferase FdhD [Lachnospiraceae bacterium]|nr:formate dehydrogenase accessory sulfurtransferase FdhD [Lachnospiraceae bacterium]